MGCNVGEDVCIFMISPGGGRVELCMFYCGSLMDYAFGCHKPTASFMPVLKGL